MSPHVNNSLRPSLHLPGWKRGWLSLGLRLAVLTSAASVAASDYTLHWITNSPPIRVEVTGFNASDLRQLPSEIRPHLLSVYASQGNLMTDLSVPAMLGSYSATNGVLRFEPRFPFEPHVAYRAVFRPSKLPGTGRTELPDIVSRFQLPAPIQASTTTVTQIYPSAAELPENLLKFYLHFSAPMRGGHVYQYIHLRDESGTLVELPFLELDEELWNPEMTRLTVFIDPGRIKREVKPLEEIGPALEQGKGYTLEIDSTWRDAEGQPLRAPYRKTFRVTAPDREPPDLANWKITPPRPATREPLTVVFPESMDAALAIRMISVADPAGRALWGKTELSKHETCWKFRPDEPWKVGRHQLRVQTTIEDRAGNNIGKAFEEELLTAAPRPFTNQIATIDFEMGQPGTDQPNR